MSKEELDGNEKPVKKKFFFFSKLINFIDLDVC
jgi:hypothetical protein